MRPHELLRRVLLVSALTTSIAVAATPQRFATFPEVAVGITAPPSGRVFVSFSRAIDPSVAISVAEVKDGKAVPFPPGFKQDKGPPAPERLLSVQALVVDARNRLWLLDTGKVGTDPERAPPKPAATKAQKPERRPPAPAPEPRP